MFYIDDDELTRRERFLMFFLGNAPSVPPHFYLPFGKVTPFLSFVDSGDFLPKKGFVWNGEYTYFCYCGGGGSLD